MAKIHPYQIEVATALEEQKRILVADGMGMGKCAESLSARIYLERQTGEHLHTLIVSPGSVADHWRSQIATWYSPDASVVRVTADHALRDLTKAKKADFTIIPYSTLTAIVNKPDGRKLLQNVDFRYAIIDEVHNAKNPDSLRSAGVRSTLDGIDYLALLSGTPLPNSIADLYMIMHLLEPDQFPIESAKSGALLLSFSRQFAENPGIVKNVLTHRMLRRDPEVYLGSKVPALSLERLAVMLTGDHHEAYLRVYEDETLPPGEKIVELRKASIDPNLVRPELLGPLAARQGSLTSSVYGAIDGRVEQIVSKGGKAIIFTDFKAGVIERLVQRYQRFGAIGITGDVSSEPTDQELSEREQLRKDFQTNPHTRVLISSPVMDEGVDLTAATHAIHLTMPYTPAAFDQRNRRTQRVGEVTKDNITSITIMPELPEGIRTITAGIELLLQEKRRVLGCILELADSITNQDLYIAMNGHPEKTAIVAKTISPYEWVRGHLGSLKAQGAAYIHSWYDSHKETAAYIAKLYTSHWDGYYAGNTATLLERVLSAIGIVRDNGRILDAGSGPFSLSRRIGEPVVNLDINKYMLKAGREIPSMPHDNLAAAGSFTEMPYRAESFATVVTSLTLHMTQATSEGMPDREQTFREFNRVLMPGGVLLAALPHSVVKPTDVGAFYREIEKLGFTPLGFSGVYKGTGDAKFKVYLCALQKIGSTQPEPLAQGALAWKMDSSLANRTGQTKPGTKRNEHKSEQKPEFCANFVNAFSGKTLEESIREAFR